MLQKRFCTILTAAALALSAIPALPVTAAEEPAAPVTASESASCFTPGSDWQQYGDICCKMSLNQPDDDCQYIGLRAAFSEPEATVCLVSQMKTPFIRDQAYLTFKAGSGRQYDVFDLTAGQNQYWCAPAAAGMDWDSDIEMHAAEFLAKIEEAGLALGRLQSLEPFAMGSDGQDLDSVIKSSDIHVEKPDPEKPPVRYKSGQTADGFTWELYQAPESGEAWIAPNPMNGFSANWQHIPEGSLTRFCCTKEIQVSDLTSDTEALLYHYSAEGGLMGSEKAGVMLALADHDGITTEVQVVDAWGDVRPAYDTYLGECKLDCGSYDLYQSKQEIFNSGTQKTEQRTQYIAVRKENLHSADTGEIYENSVNFTGIMKAFQEAGLKPADSSYAFAAVFLDASEGSGHTSFLRNEPTFVKSDISSAYKFDTTSDGCFWSTDCRDEIDFRYEKEGRFSCKWTQTHDAEAVCGICYREPVTPESLGQILYSYEAGLDLETDGYAGVYCELAEPDVHIYIADARYGELPEALRPTGSYAYGGISYDVYEVPVNSAEAPLRIYWIVRQKNLLGEEQSGTVKNVVNVSAHLEEAAKLGIKVGKIGKLAAFAAAPASASGSVSFTKNQLMLSPKYVSRTAAHFRLGKALVKPDLDESAQSDAQNTDFFRSHFEIASLETVLSPGMYLDANWNPDEPIAVHFSTLQNQYLSYCEQNQIPVVIGPFVSALMLPAAYYQDTDKTYVSSETMNARYNAIIKATFETLEKEYPALIIDSVIVTSGIYTNFNETAAQKILNAIYGEGDTGYVAAAFRSVRKYCPAGCKLCLGEMLNPDAPMLSVITTAGEELYLPDTANAEAIIRAAEALKSEQIPLDSIALCCGFYDACDWQNDNSYFSTALRMLADTGLELMLSEVIVSANPPYNNAQRIRNFTNAMAAMIRNSEYISTVILSDSNLLLDGPVPLSQMQDFDSIIPEALSMQQPMTVLCAGDVNCDGSVDVSDAVRLARFLAEDKTAAITADGRQNADADGSSEINADDVMYILRIIAKLV